MPMFRKKIPTEADRYTPGMEDGFCLLWPSGMLSAFNVARADTQAAFDGMFRRREVPHTGEIEPSVVPVIATKEGFHAIGDGDWIAIGPAGERYPIKPDIFAATYEPVNL